MAEPMQLTLEFHERIFYATQKPVSVRALTESLLALDRLVRESPPLLTQLSGIEVLRAELLIQEIRAGSLIEDVVVKLFFGDQEKLNAWLERQHKRVGDGMLRDALITAAVAALVAAGGLWAAKAMQSGAPATTTIEANNNIIFNIGAAETAFSPEQFRLVVETAVKDRKEIAKNAVKVLSPAKADPQGTLTIGDQSAGAPTAHFPAPVIQQTPSAVTFEAETTEQSFDDVDLQLRAMDLDNKKRGWGGLIPPLFTKRVRIELDHAVDPRQLTGRMSVRADVTVKYKPDPKQNGTPVPHLIVVHRIIDDADTPEPPRQQGPSPAPITVVTNPQPLRPAEPPPAATD